MPSNQDIKKVERKADAGLPDRLCRRGRQEHQKLKPYLILQYLLKYSDENNIVSTPDLIGYLEEVCQIHADRRSIYRDIEEINLV